MKYKVAHIHTDPKFTHNTRMFDGPYFENTQIIINKKDKEDTQSKSDSGQWTTSSNDLESIIEICSKSDLVVLYDLDRIKIKIALALPNEIKIAWRFFGHELYGRRPDLFKSKLTRRYENTFIKDRIKKTFIYKYLSNKITDKEINYAIQRINFFMALSQEEYNFLKQHWPRLPIFVKLPHFHLGNSKEQLNTFNKDKSRPLIIVGNSRSSFNNHLDVINIIEKYNSKHNYLFEILFNYGTNKQYAQKVINLVQYKPYYKLNKVFMSKNNFDIVYQKATALVINGYRQMAGANIRTALINGVKVYLSSKNIHKEFLQNEGFIIYSIDDFENDLKNNNIYFDTLVANYNINNFKSFRSRYTQLDFQNNLKKLIDI